jgi:CheY-like chemotaxis protein
VTLPNRVLLVEDNPGDAELIRDTLEGGELPLEIAVVADGVDAIDHLFRRGRHAAVARPDLIVLDLNLPRLDGREVLAEIRRHDHLATIPVVILTSSDAGNDISQSYRLGANCYVTKPVGLAAFQATIKAIAGFWLAVARLP